MPKTVGQFIFDLAKKAGVKEDDEALKAFIQDKEFFDKAFPEALQTGIDNELISIKDAQNNHPVIKPYYTQQSLAPVDKLIETIVNESDFDDDTKALLTAKTNTHKRLGELITRLKAQKKEALNKGDKDAIQKQVDDLHKVIADKDLQLQNKDKQYDSDLSKIKIEYKLDSLTGNYKTIYDDLEPEVKAISLKTIINKNLQDNKAVFAFDDKGNFTLLKEDGTNYYGDNHQQIEPKGFIEKILSQNKLLKVTDQTGNGQGNNSGHKPPPQGGSGNNTRNATLSGMTQQILKDLDAANNVPIMG